MTLPPVSYKRHRFPPEIIGYAIWLYLRFPLSLRLVEEMLFERGILVSYETVRRWALKFGQEFARRLKRKRPSRGDIWHLMRSGSASPVRRIGSGARLIRKAMFSTKSCRPGATAKPQPVCCGAC